MSNLSKGYLLGKLFAQLEREGVVRMEDYQTASTSPGTIVHAFSQLAKVGKMDAITEVMNELPRDAFDEQVLSPSDQQTFPLGYWQEKARWLEPESDEPLTTNLVVRIEPSLKEWTVKHGGSELVRSLLRKKRAEEN